MLYRSALKRIVERDDTACKRLVLCVSDITHSQDSEQVSYKEQCRNVLMVIVGVTGKFDDDSSSSSSSVKIALKVLMIVLAEVTLMTEVVAAVSVAVAVVKIA